MTTNGPIVVILDHCGPERIFSVSILKIMWAGDNDLLESSRLYSPAAQQLRAGGPVASEPHDNFAVAEGMRNAIVKVWAADTSGEMNKWISDSGTSC